MFACATAFMLAAAVSSRLDPPASHDPRNRLLDREAARLTWARAATGNPTLELHRASVDAGFRSYWRGNGR